jgi:hypothetical protein
MTHTQTVREMKANEDGRSNLAGFEITCTCGHRLTTTMQSNVPFYVREHVEVMTRKDRKGR